MSFEGKRVIVTGAASGIGAATTRLFTESGATVFAVDVNLEGLNNLVQQLGGNVIAHQADMAVQAEVEGMVQAGVERLGGLDILVNNAGIGSLAKAGDLDPAIWRQVMAVDLDAVFWASRIALPHLVASKGSIVNTASISGIGADHGFTAYNAAKTAVVALTRTIAIDYAVDGVRCNSVSPGIIASKMTSGMPPKVWDGFVKATPMKRGGKPEEIANTIAFLASDQASFITGQNIAVDGGLTAHNGSPGWDAWS